MLPNFRRNPLTGHWVIVAEERQHRPNEFASDLRRQTTRRCPFCAGHEDDTPGEVATFSEAGLCREDDQWVVRVVPNKYPALRDNELAPLPEAAELQRGPSPNDPYGCLANGGVHELIVESRRHIVSYSELTKLESRVSMRVYRDRLAKLAGMDGIHYGMLFKNCRPGAGASIEHVHSQLIGTPVVPSSVSQQLERTSDYFDRYGRKLGIDLANWERDQATRVVCESEHFLAFCPFASHLAYETWISPKSDVSDFIDLAKSEVEELADMLLECCQRVDQTLSCPPYNFAIHLSPFDSPCSDHYQWHLELSPRLSKLAGFEWGTGCMILQVSPETAAQKLRDAQPL